mgnify:CR=1 FL=1
MSIFPFMDADVTNTASKELEIYKEYAYDFENNCLKLRNGTTYLVEKNEALKIWIYKALITERFRYLAYTSGFGNEAHTLIGRSMNSEITFSELRRFIVESLMVNPYIEELENFTFEKSGSALKANFDCNTVYGTIEFEMKWDEV